MSKSNIPNKVFKHAQAIFLPRVFSSLLSMLAGASCLVLQSKDDVGLYGLSSQLVAAEGWPFC